MPLNFPPAAARGPVRRRRPHAGLVAALAALLACVSVAAPAQQPAPPTRTTLTIGMTLEPNGLDPTVAAASAIAEVVHYNVLESLTRIASDGSVQPLLAERWTTSADGRTLSFRLRPGVRFHNGEPLTAATVRFAFERAAGTDSTNKDKAFFASIERIDTPDPATVALRFRQPNPDAPFLLGQATAAIVEPKSAATNATQPVGTGPYRVEAWNRGASLILARWDGWRDAARVHFARVTFRFVPDPAAQVAALLAGDLDLFPRVAAGRALERLRRDERFQVLVGASRAKTILALNHRRKPLDDVRVRRAIAAAIDRQAVIDAAVEGLGTPIGSHYVPGAPGYVDTTATNPFDPARARALLKEAGVATPLRLALRLPPPPYARQGGEVIAAMLAQVGIEARIETIDWAQWLADVFRNKNYDLTIVSHVEPFDLGNYANPDYYWQYDSARFRGLWERINATAQPDERAALLADAQRLLADDAANVFLFQPRWITVADRRLKGLWQDMPVFVNDLAALRWE